MVHSNDLFSWELLFNILSVSYRYRFPLLLCGAPQSWFCGVTLPRYLCCLAKPVLRCEYVVKQPIFFVSRKTCTAFHFFCANNIFYIIRSQGFLTFIVWYFIPINSVETIDLILASVVTSLKLLFQF